MGRRQHTWHEDAHHPLLWDGGAECRAPSRTAPSPWCTLVTMVPSLHKSVIPDTALSAGMSQKAHATLCSPWKPWHHCRESLLQPQSGDDLRGCTRRSSGEYPLSADIHTTFHSDKCRRSTSKSTFLSEIQSLIPTTNHALTNFRSPSKYRGVTVTQTKSTHLSRSENKHFLPLFHSQKCLKFSGHHFPKQNN